MPFIEINESGTNIQVQTLWNEKEIVKAVPGSRWNAVDKYWTVPLTMAACSQLKGSFQHMLEVGPLLTQWIWNEWNTRVHPSLSLRSRFEDKDKALHFHPKLYDFQTMGVAWLTTAGSGLLGDEMGTGKTIQVLVAMDVLGDCLPALVIAPNSVKANWAKEAAIWLPQATPYVITGTASAKAKLLAAAAQDPTALVVTNFESTFRLSRLAGYGSIRLIRCKECDKQYGLDIKPAQCEVHPRILNTILFHTVIVDEAHRIKDPKAKQTRATWALGSGNSVSRRWALTGTPLANDPSDLWSIMHFVEPLEYPTKSKFVDRYCTPPDSPVWMADGTFKRIGEIVVGDKVIGFDKTPIVGKGKHAKYGAADVLAVNRRHAKLVRVTLTNGDSFICTPDHKWLVGWRRMSNNGPRVMQFGEAAPGVKLKKLIDPPKVLDLTGKLRDDAMWLGGIYDGEGSYNGIAQSQRVNPDIHAKIGEVLRALDVPFTVGPDTYKITGGRDGFCRFLHYTQPLKRKWKSTTARYEHQRYMYEGSMGGTIPNSGTIISVEDAGEGEVVSLTTSTQTYVVHGYASHNCLQAWNSHGGLDVVGINPTTKEEFFKIFDPRFRRMPKALVLTQLPPKIRQTRLVEMTPKQKKAYDEIAKRLVTRLDDGSILVAKSNLSAQIRLLQLASSYCTITTGDDPNNLTQWVVELAEPSPKVDELMAVLDELGDRPVVVAAEQRKLIELAARRLDKAGISYGLITGAIDAYDRQRALEDFQAGKLRVLLFTLKAGGTGLTMTAADTIIFLQRSWSMIDNLQAEDRVHRIGSEIHESINVVDIVTQDTVEEQQIGRLLQKQKRLEEITRDRATLTAAGKSIVHLDDEENKIMNSFLGEPE